MRTDEDGKIKKERGRAKANLTEEINSNKSK